MILKSSKTRFKKKPISKKQIGVNFLCEAQKEQYNQLDEANETLFQQTYKQFEILCKFNWNTIG